VNKDVASGGSMANKDVATGDPRRIMMLPQWINAVLGCCLRGSMANKDVDPGNSRRMLPQGIHGEL
jgi:hypothetical protein